MRITLLIAMLGIAISGFAQYLQNGVVYLEKVGDGKTRVFSVTVPVDKKIEKMQEAANLALLNALLYDGVKHYNNGDPLVDDPMNSYAKSIVEEKNRVYNTFCKNTYLESSDHRKAGHFIIELNHYNLLRLLKMRGAMTGEFQEDEQ